MTRGHRHPPSLAMAGQLRDTRVLLHLTQDEVGERMRAKGHATWSRATVSEIERRGRSLTLDEVMSLAEIFPGFAPDLNDGMPSNPAGMAAAVEIRRIRESQRLTYVELSAKLASEGRPIPVLGLRRIERGERRIDVDDLIAIARVLNVPPAQLVPCLISDRPSAPDEDETLVSKLDRVQAALNELRSMIAG